MSPRRRARLFLIDASSQIFRAYHAIPELANSKGLPTNAVYGFTNMLRKLLREHEPELCAAVFDPPGPTVRHRVYEDYKKSRPQMPDDLAVQIPYVKRVLEAFRIPVLEVPEFEADDVIGTLAARARAGGLETVIVSEDKDLLQLVGQGVTMLSERGDRQVFDDDAVRERYGVPPERIPDLLALMGDSIDDIPGVKGIGAVGARKIIAAYGSVEEALARIDEISPRTYRESLRRGADLARLSKELATVRTDLPLELDLEALRRQEPDRRACQELFAELEFRGLLQEFAEVGAGTGAYRILGDVEALQAAVAEIRAAGRLCLALQTTGEEATRAELVGIALSWRAGEGAYLPVGHRGLGARNAMEPEQALAAIGPLLTGVDVELVGHDLKQVLVVLARHGLGDVRPGFDTMLASYLLHPTRQGHGLEAVALEVLGVRIQGLRELLPGKGASVAELPVEAAGREAAERADLALRLAELFRPELEAQGLGELLRQLELPLVSVLAAMELRGVRIDSAYLARMSEELGEELGRLADEIYALAGGEFNLNSPRQLAEVLFERLGLPSLGRTAKTGRRSTRAEVLEALADRHPIVPKILEYRELSKLKGTYVDALPTLVHPDTGRVHTSFNQAVAATGRLTSSNPNLQNIPVRTPLGRRIRRAFVPADGHLLLTADYSQIELRIMAHLSGDPGLRNAFASGQDIHRATAAEIFGLDPDQVTDAQRDRAKVINYGILYGMGPQRLAREFGISTAEAAAFIDRYFEVHAAVKAFLDGTVERARREGYVTTLLGRIRHLPELHSPQPGLRAFGERVAVNTPIQGSAADLIKRAMVTLAARLQREGLGSAMIIQVHDELVLEVPEAELKATAAAVRQEMEGAIELEVPLVVEIGWGRNWMEAKP